MNIKRILKWSPLLVIPLTFVLVPHCQAAKVIDLQDGSYTTIEEFRNRPDRVTQRTAADIELESAVMRALQGRRGIAVTAENGTVTLKGKVKNAQERLDLVTTTQSVNGVKSVRAEITVPGEYNEAEEIRTRSRQLGLDLF